ncbi:hypothetical protein Tsubulata_049116 [Turnera subulata]|uniref:Uncharacterized protein n=1 Tax=Turnera subulata TaxID=218843 RepID=A0A9Q0JIX7_9ROSI|nr:hypothetical protein Tsubulata_049116 [Turnera subulata]
MQFFRRLWTMPVELGLTVPLPIKMVPVSNLTLSGLIALTPLTATSRRRANLQAPVILLAQLLSPPVTPAQMAVLTRLPSAGTSTTTPVTTTPSTNTPTTTTPSTTTPSSTTPTTTSPYSTTPNGVLGGGIGTGMGPSGAGINTDITDAGLKLQSTSLASFFLTLSVSGLMLLWG